MELTCPSQDRLREYLEGSVNDTDSEKILDHIEGCSSCDHVLTTMESEQNDVMNEVCEFVRTESLLQEPEFEQLRNTAPFSQADTTAPADVEEHSETGKQLRDYRLVRKIGEGGMGTVYQAVHLHLAKHVALKILPADKLQSGQSVKRFRQEMRAVGKVNHPNVVSASDAGTIDGQHFLVMELVQGADLARIIHERGPLNVADACEIVRQAAIGLQHAHDTGLVHRDVKPSNIMLALDGSVKLLDLGLAGLNNTEFESTANVVVTDRLTSVGQIMGTLDYMAPEQIKASPEVDGKADIYALGATLFQLLTGRTPCGDRSEGTPERIEAVLHKPPLEIAQLRSDVPEELRALLLKMLAKNPEDRPESAIDVASELKHSASDADLVALAEECRTSLDMPSADVDVTEDVSFVVSRNIQPQGEGNSRRPFTAVALASFFLALVAAVVYYIQTDNGIVRIEVTDPSLKVAINDQTITMTEGNKKPLTIRAGEQSLVVRQGDSDFEFETDRFQIRRGDKIAFTVERLNGEVVISRNGERFGGVKLPNDHQEIQGEWQVVSARQDDVVNVGMDASLTVDGHAFTLSYRGASGAIAEERTGRIEIDGTKNPKTVDFFDSKENGEDLIGIYKIEGDILTICVGEVHERKRPRDFKWPQGSGIMRMECQRRKSAAGGMDIHTPGVREAALRTSSHNNMKHITFALLDYYKAKQQWPDKLDALLPFLEVGKSVFENPLTGDNLGYDYVKPTAPLEDIPTAETIVLYQLRDGKRDRQLACAYLDGQVSLSKDAGRIEAKPEPPERPELAAPGSSYGAVYWEPDGPKMIFATARERFESEELIKSARQSVKDDDVKAATDAYLKVLSLDPYLLGGNVVELFQQANRLSELGECIDETGLKRRIYEDSLSREAIKALLNDEKTRDLGLRVLRNYFRIYHRGRHNVLTSPEDHGIVWKDVPDLIYFLRVLLIPTDFEQEGEGWGRYSVLSCGDRGEGRGPLTDASVLFFDKDVLRTFTNEVRALTKENPGWKGGLVLLATLEAELGNFDKSVAIINEHFIGPTEPVIPVSTAWVLGLALEGKNHDLDQFVIRLYEYSLRKIVSNFDDPHLLSDPLRVSPLNELAQLYAKYGRKEEARQLLYGLVDASDQHPLVQGYMPSVFHICNYGPSRSCIACHRTEMNLPDYVLMSDVMTDIGYPVDSLISLARIDASFGNAFTSSDGWIEQDSGEGKRLYELAKEAEVPTAKNGLPLQKRRAEQAVTPRSVIDALELGTFETKRRYSQKTYDRIRRRDFRSALDFRFWARTLKLEEKPSDAIDLMLSVRGEGPDAKATVFSPVIDVLKLAADFKGENAAKEIADLDARLRLLTEVNSRDVQVLVASTVFAFLRDDLESAKKRLEALKDLKLSSEKDAQRANATLWLAARYALQYEKTRAVGAVLAERSLAAAKTLPDTRFKEAILRERTGAGLGKILERRPDLREKLAQKAEELGNTWLAERLRSDPKVDDGVDLLALANRLAKEDQWDSACDAFLEAFRSDPNLFGAYVDGDSVARKQIGCFEKAGRLTDLARFFDVTTLQRRRTSKTYGMDDLVIRLTEDRSPETRSAGYELLERVFQHRESVADWLLRRSSYKRLWKSVPNPVFLLRCWLIPKDIEKRGWAPFALAATNEDKGTYSNRLTNARPLLGDPKALRKFADEVRELLQKHPTWIGGWALLASLEGEIGNYREAAQLVRDHILTADPETIPAIGLWSLGDVLYGKDQELNGIAVNLWELAVRKYAANPSSDTLRVSPISTLARAYAEDNRGREGRRLLFGLVDPVKQHPLVEGYAGNNNPCRNGNRCITCHSNGRENEFGGFYDVIKMSEAMTEIGYPVDTLVELARADASFRNAFSSSGGWVDPSSENGKHFAELFSRRSAFVGKYDEQASKARAAVTPRKVIDALETDAFYRSSLRDAASVAEALGMIRNAVGDDEKTKAIRELARASQQQENNKKAPIDLLLSVRGEGPEAQATVFSPVVEILKLAVESKATNAAKDIAELDKRLVELSEQHPNDIEAGIAATVFAFLRKDVDSAKDRLKQLQSITDYSESDGAAFWLVAREALRHDETRILGRVLAERALTAAKSQPDSGLKEAILLE